MSIIWKQSDLLIVKNKYSEIGAEGVQSLLEDERTISAIKYRWDIIKAGMSLEAHHNHC